MSSPHSIPHRFILKLIQKWLSDNKGALWLVGDPAEDLCFEIGLTPVVDAVIWERAMQLEKGFDLEHDDGRVKGEILKAAICYAQVALQREGHDEKKVPFFFMPHAWPWKLTDFHPSEDPVENLVKAAAMMIAEAERLMRLRDASQTMQAGVPSPLGKEGACEP